MLSLPDFREKNILFITGSDIRSDAIHFNNENICFKQDGKIVNQVSCHKLLGVFIIGDCTVTTPMIRKCNEYGVSIFLMTNRLRVYASFLAKAEGNYVLRSKQYHASKKSELEISKAIVSNKINNQFALLFESKRDAALEAVQVQTIQNIQTAKSIDSLRGIEGSVSKLFFATYFKDHKWYRRMPRSKVDPNNVLLDIGYHLLFNYVDAIISLYGFDTYKGIYHQLFFERKSLVCDLMEPFRCIVDRQIRKGYNLKQIQEKDFTCRQGEYDIPYQLQEKYLALFTNALMQNKEQIFIYLRDYYYCILNETNEYPIFNIK